MFAVRVLPSSIVPGNKKPLQAITEINKMKSILAVLLLTTSLEASAFCNLTDYACLQYQQQQQNSVDQQWNEQREYQQRQNDQQRQNSYNSQQQIYQQQELQQLRQIENQLRYR